MPPGGLPGGQAFGGASRGTDSNSLLTLRLARVLLAGILPPFAGSGPSDHQIRAARRIALPALLEILTTKSEANRGGLANPVTESDGGDTWQTLREGRHFVNRRISLFAMVHPAK